MVPKTSIDYDCKLHLYDYDCKLHLYDFGVAYAVAAFLKGYTNLIFKTFPETATKLLLFKRYNYRFIQCRLGKLFRLLS
jgi:hypothetical protein